MEPILENIELPNPNPQATPNWNPANAPIPLEFYDNAPDPRYAGQLNSSFADFNFDGDSTSNSTFELDFSDPEFQSFEDESDASSVKSSDSKKIARGRNRIDKRREWGLQSPVPPIPRNSKRTETYQYHLISPIFKDRYHYVSKDNPKFQELEGKDPEFDECRYKYFIICVGSHFWKRTRNQVIRPARSGARRQKQVQVRDRRMNVQTFYYSLTFELETMAPLQLRSYSDVIKAIKTQIPPQAPQLFSVTYTTFDSPVKFTVTSQALASPVRSNNHLPELTYSKDFKSCKEVDPFAPGKFMDNLEELSQLDVATTKGGPVLVTAIECAKVDSFGKILPVEYKESQILQCNTDVNNVSFEAGVQELLMTSSPHSRNEKSLQLTPNSSIFKTSSGTPPAQVTLDLSPNSAGSTTHKTVHTAIIGGTSPQAESVSPPPPPERTMASMNKSPDRYVSPVFFQATESHSSILNNAASVDPEAMNTSWTNMADPALSAEWDKLNVVNIIENPSVQSEEFKQLNRKKHKCAFTGVDGLCRCCHFSHAHAHEGHYQDMTDSGVSGDLYGSNTSLDTLINELWSLSKPERNEDVVESQTVQPDWSCEANSLQGPKDSAPMSRAKKRPSSPRLPENFVADMDQILQKQIADLEREQSVSPLPKSLSESPVVEVNKPERPSTLDLQKTQPEDRSQNYELDALGGDEGLQFAYFRHSPIDSDLDSSSVSSYNSLSPQPRKERKKVVFKDETEAFEYFGVKHFDSPYVQPSVINKKQIQDTREPPPTPPRGSSKSRTSARMFCDETDAFEYFKIKHFPKFEEQQQNSQDYIRARQEFIDQLNNYTPRIQPAVPKRKDSSKKFQRKLLELSRLSAACGEVADQIKHDHQEYWGALTSEFKLPEDKETSLVSEAYQRMAIARGEDSVVVPSEGETRAGFSSPSESRRAVQTDLRGTGMISAAISDNIVNMASSVNQTSSSPRTMRNEIRIDVTPSPEVRSERPPLMTESQGRGQGHNLRQGLWSTSPSNVPKSLPQNHKRSVTWCDDLTSTDDDRMSDSSASVTPDRKLDPASSLKSIQKTHSTKKKKKKVSWSDDYNTDDDRHSSSTSLSSVFEPNSPDVSRHISNVPTFGPGVTSPLVNTSGDNVVRSPHTFQKNISWPVTDFGRSHKQQTACPIYGQPLLSQPTNSKNGASQPQMPASSSPLVAHSQHGPPGAAKTSIGVQRFRVENKFSVEKPEISPKPQGFPAKDNAASKFNGHGPIRNQQFRC